MSYVQASCRAVAREDDFLFRQIYIILFIMFFFENEYKGNAFL